MNIHVKLDGKSRPQPNFWNNIHFHPTDAVEDRWGQRVLGEIKKDHVANMIRLHTMFEDMVTRDADGALCFNFSESDVRTDYMVKNGFNLLLCFDFMPVCMATDPLKNFSGVRYKGKRYNRSAPKDYTEWEQVCRVYTAHLIERYGEDIVSNWYFHCWNEPDSGFWITNKGNDAMDADGDMDKIEEYCKLYDYFEKGVTAVTRKPKLGGPSCAGSDRFIRLFLQHVSSQPSCATGKSLKLDFVSVHCYSQGIYSALPNKTFISPDNILQRLNNVQNMMDENGLSGTEMLFDEWGIAGGGFIGIDRDPRMLFRETEYYPAFLARLIDEIIHCPRLHINRMMICLSGQHECKKDFDGFRTFFTLNGFKKPIYNGFAMYAKLGSLYLENDAPADPYTGIIPTADEKGNVKLLIYHHYDEFYKTCPNEKVCLTLTGISGKYRISHYRIDATTSNAYTKWLQLGSPAMPDFSQREQMTDAGELSLWVAPEEKTFDGSYTENIVMTQNAVSLLELEKLD